MTIKLLITTSILFCTQGYSQNIDFTLANPQPNLVDVYGGSFASGDIDVDGDKDLLVAGLTPARETALYLNDGLGNFTEVTNIPFPEASNGVSIFKDLDGDGDLDLFFSGRGFNIGVFTHIYINNGSGIFTRLLNPALPNIDGGGAVIEDVDNDGDADIVISEQNGSGIIIADIYFNDGTAIFSASGSTNFTGVKNTAMAFIDAEGDGDQDLVISGKDANNIASVKLYLNNGTGTFTVSNTTTFEIIAADDIDVADTDNDGDLDILISGTKTPNTPITVLYTNDGAGLFTAITTNLQQTFVGTNAIADLDNDGDQDIVIIGSQAGGIPNIFNIVYQNVGNNVFNAVDTIGGEYIAACVVEDFNGDGLKDIIMQGFVDNTNVYWNNSTVLSTPNYISNSVFFKLYPNPSNGTFYINPSFEKQYSIKIYNITGELIYNNDLVLGQIQLNLNPLSGIYFTVIESENILQTNKLLISN